jgi:type IV pilus assembly protein PilW
MAASGALRGFSVVEVLIAATLGTLVLLAASDALVLSRAIERSDQSQARNLDNARMAMALMARRVRQAGYPGCHPDRRRNLISTGEDPASPALAINGALTTRTWRSAGVARILRIAADGERLALDRAHGVEKGRAVGVFDRRGGDCVVFRQGSDAADVLHRGPGSPRVNRRPAAGYRPVGDAIEILVPARTVFYTDTAVSGGDARTLFRRRDAQGGDREALVVGVRSLALEAGIDEDGDGYVDRWEHTLSGGAGAAIRAARITLTLASDESVSTTVALRNGRP